MTRRIFLAATAAIALVGSVAEAASTFEHLPLPNSFFPDAILVSADGSALCGWSGFYWSEGTGYLSLGTGLPSNVSGDGSAVIGTYTNGSSEEVAGVWTPGAGWSEIDRLATGQPCGASVGSGYALNFDATAAVGLAWVTACRAEAFKWTLASGTVGLGRSEGVSSRATDISDDGTTTVGFDEDPVFGGRRPALWTDAVSGPQYFAGAETVGEALGVSSDGSRICGIANNSGFYYDATSGVVDIGALPGEIWGSTATAVADDGTVVGWSGNPFFSFPAAIIWSPYIGLMSLADYAAEQGIDLGGYYLYNATSISADGRTIAGTALDPTASWFVPYVIRLEPTASVDPAMTASVLSLTSMPNPFALSTTMSFALPVAERVQMSVLDMSGRIVAQLADRHFEPGSHQVSWDGTDEGGRAVSSGTYFVRVQDSRGTTTRKISVVR